MKQHRSNKRRFLPRFSLRAIFALLALTSIVIGVWRAAHERHEREQQSLILLYPLTCNTRSVIPPSIRPLIGERIARDFEVVTECDLAGVTSFKSGVTPGHVEELNKLRSLEVVAFRQFHIDAAGAKELAKLRLKKLDVTSCWITQDEAVEILRNAPSIDQVEYAVWATDQPAATNETAEFVVYPSCPLIWHLDVDEKTGEVQVINEFQSGHYQGGTMERSGELDGQSNSANRAAPQPQ